MEKPNQTAADQAAATTSSPASLLEKNSFREALRRAVFQPVAALVVAMVLLLGLLAYLFSIADRADHSNQVLAQISRVEKLAIDMETGVRGYRITGSNAFLEPFQKAAAMFDAQLNALESLLREDPFQLSELRALRTTHATWSEFATNVRDTVRAQLPPDAALHMHGKVLMDAVRAHISAMQDHERRLLAERSATRGQVRTMAVAAVILSAIILAPMMILSARRALLRVNASYGAALGTVEAARERLRVTLSSIGDAVVATDAEGRVTYMNPVAVNLTGWRETEASGQPLSQIFKIINEHSRKPVENPVENVLREGRVVGLSNHTLLIARDGRETPIADSAAPIRDASGDITGVVLVFRDQAAERNAAAKVEWLASFPEGNPNPVVELDSGSGKVVYANTFTDETFPDLRAQGARHHFFAGLQEAAQPLFEGKSEFVRREMSLGGRCFAQTIRYLPETRRLRLYCSDITQSKLTARLLDSQKHSLEMVVSGAPLSEVLTYLARVVEEQSDGKATASILLLDSDGLLRNGASPTLPPDYLQAIDGLKPCAGVGTCCAAAATGQVVLTPDIAADPNWQSLKHLPLNLGFVAAWSQPITSSDGRVLGTFGTYFRECREPTAFERQTVEILSRTAALAIERRRVEDERKRFVSLAQNSSDFIGMCGPDFLPFFVNGAGLAMVGLKNIEQARQTPVKEFFFPEDQDRVINEFFPSVLSHGQGQIEIRFRHFETGAALWMLYNVWVVTNDQGQFAGLATVSRDITDRKRAEDALRASEERYRSLFESIDEGFCVIEMIFDAHQRPVDYRFLEVNPAFERQAGMQGVTGKRMLEFVSSIERHWLENYGRVALSGEPIRFADEYKSLGSWFDVYAFRVGDPEGRRVAVIFNNITKRIQAEEAARRSQIELAAANKELTSRARQLDTLVEKRTAELRETVQQLETFSYSIVHDLRAPLRSMRSFAGFLHQDHSDRLDQRARDYLRRIMDSAARMDALITDVLNYSRVSRGSTDLSPVDLDRLVPEIIEQYPHFHEKAEFIRVTRPLPRVAGNTALLTQVFSNLLGNALKFVPAGREPRIEVRAESNCDNVRVWIEDNGIGIPPDQHERIFGLFQRLHRFDEYVGTGVGLAIVKRAVEKMGGKTGVESEPGKGSQFWIELRLPDPRRNEDGLALQRQSTSLRNVAS